MKKLPQITHFMALVAVAVAPLAQAQSTIYNNTFSTAGSPGLTPQGAGSVTSDGNVATVVNTGTSFGYFSSPGIVGMPSVANTANFTMSCDFILGAGMATSTSARFGYGLFSTTTSPSWQTPNAMRMLVTPDASANPGNVQIAIQNWTSSSINDSIASAYVPTVLSYSDTYQLISDFTFSGTPGVAGSSGVNQWEVALSLYDVSTSTTVASCYTSGNWYANTISLQNLADGTAQVALFARGTPAGGMTADNFSITVVPEPSTLALCALGACWIALAARRRSVDRH